LTRAKFTTERELQVDQQLKAEWEGRYESLTKNVVMQDYDSGRFWAGLFIARLLKSVHERRVHN